MADTCYFKTKVLIGWCLNGSWIVEMLHRKGVLVETVHVLCGQEEKSLSHIFLRDFFLSVWNSPRHNLQLPDFPTSMQDLWTSWRASHILSDLRLEWDMHFMVIVWSLWSEWNQRIFLVKARHSSAIFYSISVFVSFWLGHVTEKQGESLLLVMGIADLQERRAMIEQRGIRSWPS